MDFKTIGIIGAGRLGQAMASASVAALGTAATTTPTPPPDGSHLYRIFPKLGITARGQLQDALAAGTTPPMR